MQTFLSVPFPPFFVLSRQYTHLLQSFFLQLSHSLQETVRLLVLICSEPVVGRAEGETERGEKGR